MDRNGRGRGASSVREPLGWVRGGGRDASGNAEPCSERVVAAQFGGVAGDDRGRDSGVHHPGASGGAGLAAGGEYHAGGGGDVDHLGDPHAAGIQRISDDPADHDADAAGAERGHDAADFDAGRRGRFGGGGGGDSCVRGFCGGEPGSCRRDTVFNSRCDSICGDHAGCDAD